MMSMQLTNQTRKTTLSESLVVPKKLIDQTLGLLKYKTPVAMFLRTHFGIHTFGMQYAIDVLILDSQNSVVAMKENMKPNRIFLWNPKYDTILELPRGTIQKTQTRINDTIIFNK